MKLKSVMTVGQLAELYVRNKRLELNPAFQRDSVWREKARLLLIDSIMKGYPIPAIFLCVRHDGHKLRYDVIDGKQRLESIFAFMGLIKGHGHSLFHGKVKDEEAELGFVEYDWRCFSAAQKKTLKNYRVSVIQTEGDPDKVRNIFVRINSTGAPLTDGEILNAKYLKTPLFEQIRDFAADRKIAARLMRMGVVNDSKKNRRADVLILAEIIMSRVKDGLLDKKRALDEMLNEKAKRLTMRDIKPHLKSVAKAIEWAEKIWLSDGRDGLKFSESRFKKTSDFYSLVVLLSSYIDSKFITDNREANRYAKRELLRIDNELRRYRVKVQSGESVKAVTGEFAEYRKSVWAAADSIEHRRIRQEILDGMLKKCFCRKDSKRGFTRDERLLCKAREIAKNGKLICYLCGEPIEDSDNFSCRGYTLDHVKAHKRGGRSVLKNARPAHRSCNSKKGARNIKRDHKAFFDKSGSNAVGVYNYYSEKIVVKSGSRTATGTASPETSRRRRELVEGGILRKLKDYYKFRKNYKCTPSYAACILTGRKTFNGLLGWHLKDGTPIRDI